MPTFDVTLHFSTAEQAQGFLDLFVGTCSGGGAHISRHRIPGDDPQGRQWLDMKPTGEPRFLISFPEALTFPPFTLPEQGEA